MAETLLFLLGNLLYVANPHEKWIHFLSGAGPVLLFEHHSEGPTLQEADR